MVSGETAASWSEHAIEAACGHAQEWFRQLPPFQSRVNLGSVVAQRSPLALSERDCVVTFARFLHEAGVPWDAIHHEVSIARWIFDAPHPAATGGKGRRVDLVLIRPEDFLEATLPAVDPGFQFDALLEFGYLDDYWTVPGARIYDKDPVGAREKVAVDVEKIGRHLATGACRVGYVIVFEECDHGFEQSFAADAELNHHGCRVRFVRGAW